MSQLSNPALWTAIAGVIAGIAALLGVIKNRTTITTKTNQLGAHIVQLSNHSHVATSDSGNHVTVSTPVTRDPAPPPPKIVP